MEHEFLSREIFGNPVRAWALAGGAFAAFMAFGVLLKSVVLGRLRALAAKTATDFDDTLVGALSSVRMAEIAVVAAYLATRSLFLGGMTQKVLHIALVVVATLRGTALIQGLLAYAWRSATASAQEGDPTARSAFRNVEFILNGLLWAAAALFILDNLGVNVTTAVAGLGIGGIAIAMAAQQVLGDLFSSFVIFMDKPFKVGDFIIVGELMGVVENVGIKTTRVRSLSGEVLVFSNSDLTSSRIRNFKQMKERRVVFGFGILYETPHAQVAKVPEMVKRIFQGLPKARLDRVHFKSFGASSLDFEVVYYVLDADYNLYMDVQQQANLALMERFAAEGIGFAYPTTTVYMAGGAK